MACSCLFVDFIHYNELQGSKLDLSFGLNLSVFLHKPLGLTRFILMAEPAKVLWWF